MLLVVFASITEAAEAAGQLQANLFPFDSIEDVRDYFAYRCGYTDWKALEVVMERLQRGEKLAEHTMAYSELNEALGDCLVVNQCIDR